ncbi:hypothetical protein VNO78_32684 [Psophocarpus tetragonolobus]|uniref:Uncharacterized protein n=1 Tax=Psophocarpus tetragonolobus TaxID=3891 RepID=A0AAN9RPM1_PSOTE
MLDSVLEFITQAASSSAFIFCFCNLIIVIILVDLKPSLSIHQESEIPPSKGENQKQGTKYSKSIVEKDTLPLPQAVQVSRDPEAETETIEEIEIESNYDCTNEDKEKEEEEVDDDDNNNEEDELKRRVEEFIEKVNKGWKAELLSTSSLV